jgi:hypothetical protein
MDASINTLDSISKNQLSKQFEIEKELFERQLPITQRFIEAQANIIAKAYVERAHTVRFSIPDRVIEEIGKEPLIVPTSEREQKVGSLIDRISRRDVHETLRRRLAEMEQSNCPAITISARLIRFAAANHMVNNMLPSGRVVKYRSLDADDIPSIPEEKTGLLDSSITAATDAIAEEDVSETGRGDLQVPFVPAARRFFLPQWIAFGEDGEMLVNSNKEAEAHIASMQNYLNVLFAARSIAPFVISDKEFETKRYGMLGQLVNQGRALAKHLTQEIIDLINKRASENSLNRGLSIRLPYFDDQDLRLETYQFVVIPVGRIMFVPAFVVRAALEEKAKVTQDTRFSNSTRRHLLSELQMLVNAFES